MERISKESRIWIGKEIMYEELDKLRKEDKTELYFGWNPEENYGFFAEIPYIPNKGFVEKYWLERVCHRYNNYNKLQSQNEKMREALQRILDDVIEIEDIDEICRNALEVSN
jgi:hypothetical protein